MIGATSVKDRLRKLIKETGRMIRGGSRCKRIK